MGVGTRRGGGRESVVRIEIIMIVIILLLLLLFLIIIIIKITFIDSKKVGMLSLKLWDKWLICIFNISK